MQQLFFFASFFSQTHYSSVHLLNVLNRHSELKHVEWLQTLYSNEINKQNC